MRHVRLVILGAWCAPIAASASTPTTAVRGYGAKVAACTNRADVDMRQCLARLLKPVDAEHQRAFQSALTVASEQGRAGELRQAEAEWRKFMGAQCAFERAQFRGGTGAWVVSREVV